MLDNDVVLLNLRVLWDRLEASWTSSPYGWLLSGQVLSPVFRGLRLGQIWNILFLEILCRKNGRVGAGEPFLHLKGILGSHCVSTWDVEMFHLLWLQ